MVARGDLGLELPLEQVPRVQKEVTRRARALGLPVIVATQVLESMRTEPRPTRAEVSDAANAVDDRVDAIMLAGETASGRYPLKAVQTLDVIIRDAETIEPVGAVPLKETNVLTTHGRAICDAAVTLAEHANAAAIVAVTRGGKTARVLSALRPQVPIFAATVPASGAGVGRGAGADGNDGRRECCRKPDRYGISQAGRDRERGDHRPGQHPSGAGPWAIQLPQDPAGQLVTDSSIVFRRGSDTERPSVSTP
jgi:hypothetical protein